MKRIWHSITSAVTENFSAEQSRWLVVTPFLFALGIAIYFGLPTEPSPWLTIAVFEIWLFLFYLCRYKNLHLFFIGILIIMAGFLNIQMRTIYQTKNLTPVTTKQTIYIKGKITDINRDSEHKTRLLLGNAEDYNQPLKGNFRITVNSAHDLAINDCVELVATFFPPHPIPLLNGFKLDRKYFYEGLNASGYANSEIFKIKCPLKTYSFRASVNKFRQNLADYIDSLLPPAQSGVIEAVLIGEKSRIPPQITDNYRNSGLAHFLSVSGLHLGTIAGLIFFITRFLLALIPAIALRWNIKKIAALFAIIFSALYLLISGMATPAERAFIMTTVVFIGIIFDRQAISMRMVSFAALVLLIISPQALISVSFQMSFAAVYALVAFYEKYASSMATWLNNRHFVIKIFYYLLSIIICDFIASLATTPFSIYHFQRVAIYTSLGNLLAGPLIGLWLMPTILLCLAAIPFGLAYYPLKILGYGIAVLNQITAWVAHLPYSVWHCDTLPFYGFVLIICGGFWLCIWQRPWRKWGIILIIIGIIPLFIPAEKPDIVVAPQTESIALKNDGQYIMLQFKSNNFLKQIWQENFSATAYSIKKHNDMEKLKITGLRCNEEECTYKNRFRFNLSGDIWYQNQPLNTSTGYYIYDNKIVPLWDIKQKNLWRK